MARYPFMTAVNKFMPTMIGHLDALTHKKRYTRYRQLNDIFVDMKKNGEIATTNPKMFKAEDLHAFVGYRRRHQIQDVTILDDLTFIRDLLEHFNNYAFNKYKTKYRRHYPKKYKKKPKQLPPATFRAITDKMEELVTSDTDEWRLFKAFAPVVFAIFGGLRPQEVQYADYRNVDYNSQTGVMTIFLEHVKGMKKYGEPRLSPIIPEAIPFCVKYLQLRKDALKDKGIMSNALIPNMEGKKEYLSYNQLNQLKVKAEVMIDKKFNLTMCRATNVKLLKKSKVPGEDASLSVGHNNTQTTEDDYYRKDNEDAVEDIIKIFNQQNRYKPNTQQGLLDPKVFKEMCEKPEKIDFKKLLAGSRNERTGRQYYPFLSSNQLSKVNFDGLTHKNPEGFLCTNMIFKIM